MYILNKMPTKLRIVLAIILGILVIITTRYATKETKSDVMFAEMVHSLADVLGLVFYFVALVTIGKVGVAIGKISGLILLFAGVVSLWKLHTTIEKIVLYNDYSIHNTSTLFFASVFAIICISLQLILIQKEHEKLHGHTHGHAHVHDAHHAANTELRADIIQASFGLFESALIVASPNTPLLVRLLDMLLTLWVGIWMIKRGWIILYQKK